MEGAAAPVAVSFFCQPHRLGHQVYNVGPGQKLVQKSLGQGQRFSPFFNKTSFLSCIQNLLKIICNLPDGPYTSQSTRLQSKHSPTIIVIVIATIIIISSLSKSDILLFSASFSNEIIRCLSPFNFASRIPFFSWL